MDPNVNFQGQFTKYKKYDKMSFQGEQCYKNTNFNMPIFRKTHMDDR